VEAYVAVLELESAVAETDRQRLSYQLNSLKGDYESTYARWTLSAPNGNAMDPGLALQLAESDTAAHSFFDIAQREYIPALRFGKNAQAREILQGRLAPLFREHRAHVGAAVQIVKADNEELQARLGKLESSKRGSQALGITLLTLIFAAVLFDLIARYRRSIRQNDALRRHNRELKTLSLSDNLTGLHNRHYLQTKIRRRELFAQPVAGTFVAFFMVDIDFFKNVNDSRGHLFGDEVLKIFASRLKESIRENDVLVRWGGEEFLLIVMDADGGLADDMAKRLLVSVCGRAFSVPEGQAWAEYPISCSIGYYQAKVEEISAFPEAWRLAVYLSDLGLYEAKRRGRRLAVRTKLLGAFPSEAFAKEIMNAPNIAQEEGVISFTPQE
jgi:diguanylate cyclase (GGDEF)-like protein